MPRSSAIAGALTKLTSSSTWPVSTPTSAARSSRRVSRSARRPWYSTSIRSTDEPSGERHREPPEALRRAAGTARAPRGPRRATAGMLTAFETAPPVSAATTCSAAWYAGAVLRLGGRRAEVRRDDHVGVAEERVLGDRLAAEDVERRARDLAGLERGLRGRRRRSAAPRAQLITRTPSFIFANASAFEPVLGLGRLRQVDREDVGAARRRRRRTRPSRRRARGSARRATYGSYAMTRMPKPVARSATSWPMRPKPRMPSVFSYDLDAAELRALPLAADERARAPAGCCGPARAAARSCARRRRRRSTAARWRR